MRKGQVSIYIIIGIIIVIGLVVFVYIRSSEGPSMGAEDIFAKGVDASSLKLYIEQCIERTSEKGDYLIASQGGYYELPIISTVQFNNNTAFYLYKGSELVPSVSEIENEFSKYVNDNLDKCIDFDLFREKGFEIEAKEMKVNTTLGSKEIVVTLDYPITLAKEVSVIELDKFKASVPSKLKDFYFMSRLIIRKHELDPNFIPESFIMGLADENEVSYDLIEDNETVVYALIDVEPIYSEFPVEDEEYYTFMFGVKYDWE